jgi:hypothetical protein
MTIRDREVLEELRDDPELLALADAVVETQRLRRRFRPWGAVTVVALAAALFLLVLASPWDRGGGNGFVVERALAAIDTRAPVTHVTLRISQGTRVDLSTGKTSHPALIVDVWQERGAGLVRFVARRDGELVTDQTYSGKDAESEVAFYTGFAEAASWYRDALKAGKAREDGSGEWRGRHVYWLEILDSPAPGKMRVGIDKKTYNPVVLSYVEPESGDVGYEMGVLALEYVSRNEANFGRPVPGGGGGLTSGGGTGFSPGEPGGSPTPAEARTVLGVTAVWAGPKLGDLPLESLRLEDAYVHEEGKKPQEGKALRLDYGDVEIAEVPANSPIWDSIGDVRPGPPGFADLTTSRTSSSNEPERTVWHATTSSGRVWVSIEAPSRELAIRVARELRPIPSA